MRARTREVQIFNMSLIDILCGALGAFCFMMLVLLPYYKAPGKASDLYKQQAQTQDLLKEAGKFTGAETNPAQVQQMAEMLRRLEEQIKQLQGQVNQFAAQNQQLQTANENLTKQNQEQAKTINQRRPFLAVAAADPPADIDIYLQDDVVTADKKSNPPFDPRQPHSKQYWPGDIYFWMAKKGIAVWTVRDSPPSVHYKLYTKLAGGSQARAAVTVGLTLLGENWNQPLPDVTLTPQRFWTLAGTITGEPEGKASFKEATQAERDADWTKLSDGVPPPAASAPTVPEDRKRLLEQIEQERKRNQQQQQPAPKGTP